MASQEKNKTAGQYPHKKPHIEPPAEFFKTYERLREADYSDHWLLDTALDKIKAYAEQQKRFKTQSTQDEIYYLWALCLQAEILDYYERHEPMSDVLKEDGERLQKEMKAGMLGAQYSDPSKPLVRQKLWLLVLFAHCKYRLYQPEDARQILQDVREQVNAHFPLEKKKQQNEPSYGLRARIAYSMGQVLRHLSDLHAREEFMQALYFTRQRLLAKTKKYGYCPEREQKYANYMVAKSFVFGLAWASFQGGELQRAMAAAAAGSSLLQSANDPVHRAYANVMYAQIMSAMAQPVRNNQAVPPGLTEAIALLEPLAHLDPPPREESPLVIVPKLLARARYVLANAYFMAGRLTEAEMLARQVYVGKSPGRWRLECAGLLIRILLLEGRIDEAQKFSQELQELAKQEIVTDAQRAEAYLSNVEVLLKKNGKAKDPKTDHLIEKELEKATKFAQGNPLLTAMCIAQRGRYYMRIRNKDKAHAELVLWETIAEKIENGYIKQMGIDLQEELGKIDFRLVIEPEEIQGKGDWKKVESQAKYWLLNVIYSIAKPGKFTETACEVFGVQPNTLATYMRHVGFKLPSNKNKSKNQQAKPAKAILTKKR